MKRRDVNFGSLQDQCRSMHGQCDRFENKPECPYKAFCDDNRFNLTYKPYDWSLTDPPRFTEAQMAFWKQWRVWGARYATENKGFPHIIEFMRDGGMSVGKVFHYDTLIGTRLNKDEILDLAELIGKDSQ